MGTEKIAVKKPRGKGPNRGDGWQAEKSAMTRTAILEAAISCFVEHGYGQTTTSLIAEHAGVSRGAMMHHFPSRIAVIMAVVEYLHAKRLEEYRSLMAGIDRPDAKLTPEDIRRSVKYAWRYVNLPSFVAYQELLTAARTDPELREVLQKTERDVETMFLETVKQVFPHLKNLNTLELANDMIQFTMRGMAMSHMASRRQQRAKRMINQLSDELVRLYREEGLDI